MFPFKGSVLMEFICNGGLHFVESDVYKNKFLPFTLSSRYGFQVSFRIYIQSTSRDRAGGQPFVVLTVVCCC
jgi:hypothetical protein